MQSSRSDSSNVDNSSILTETTQHRTNAEVLPVDQPLRDVRDTYGSMHLDFARGMAAIAVLIYHVRYRFFLDYSDLESHGLLTNAFYVLTSFGHDAVMVFFVLSGFLIAGSVIRDCERQRFSWKRYGLSRLTRLYPVLIPGLLLTVFWDELGMYINGTNPIYTGVKSNWVHDFFDVSQRLTPRIFVGNICFLQTVYVPPLGSNDPLWSLAYEFWYYCLFPCIYAGLIFSKGWPSKSISVLALLLIATIAGPAILAYFPMWLLGAAVCFLPSISSLSRPLVFRIVLLATSLIFVAATVLGHIDSARAVLGNSSIAADYLTAMGFAVLMYVLIHDRRKIQRGYYGNVARQASGFSYTLYITHMPLLVFFRAVLIPGRPWIPDLKSMSQFVLLSLVCLFYAYMLGQVTEARTGVIRSFLSKRLQRLGFA